MKNNSDYYTTTVENVRFNLLDRSITVNDLILYPTDLSISELKKSDSISKDLHQISLSSIQLNGIHLYKTIIKKEIEVNELELNDLIVQKFKNSKTKRIESKKKPFNLDSIYIEKINDFKINKIDINNISYQIVDIISNDTLFQHKPLSLDLDGFKLDNYFDHYFKIEPIKDHFEINDIKIHLAEKKFILNIGALNLDFEKEVISIKNFRYKPTMDLIALAKTYKYNDATFDIEIESLNVYNYDLHKTVKNEGVFIDSILVSGMTLEIFKDKSKPWNTKKIKKLPHIALKQMDLPLYINKINIERSLLKLEEQFDKKDILLKLTIDDINAQIANITSIDEYREQPLKINLKSKLMNRAKLYANMTFPLKDNESVFYFNGSLGATKFKYFDSAIFPVLGLKILRGNLQSLKFNASADNISSKGSMTMLYDDLEAEIFKSNSTEKNKVLSWTVNKVIHNSNPNKRKNSKIRIAEMHYNRINYEGFGSYLWRTLQSGITNTIAPGGNSIGKVQAKKDKKARKTKKK
ncbi:MAG: hypothetical protein ABFR32_08745 [Bacteroidota bacterium]